MPPPPPDAAGPLSLSDPARVRAVLEGAGFAGVALEPTTAPFRLGADANDAFEFMSTSGIAHGMLNGADDATRRRAFDGLRATFEAHDTGSGVLYESGAWIITAHKP